MTLYELMEVGTIADNKDSIIYYDSVSHTKIFNDNGTSNGLFLDICGSSEKEQAYLEDLLMDNPEDGLDIIVTDVMAEGNRLAVEIDRDSLVDTLIAENIADE